MNVLSINNILSILHCHLHIPQTGSRQLAAQLPRNLSDFTVAPHVATEDMVGFDEKDKPPKIIFSFITLIY